MIWGRIRERFRDRAAEWFCAGNMTWTGAALLHPSQTFTAPGWQSFRWLGEDLTGYLIGGLGLLWLVGLIINGALQSVTSTIRLGCAFVGSLAYGFLAVGFTFSFLINGVLPTAIGTNFLISALGLYSLFWITVDKRENG